MYNTRSTARNEFSRNVESFRQQQQRRPIPIITKCVTPKSTNQTQNQPNNCPQTMQSESLHNLPPQSRGIQPQVQTQTPALVTQLSEVKESAMQNNMVEEISLIESTAVEKSEVKWPVKRKINKKEQKKRLNARMRRLVCPKSPLMVFSELYKGVPIRLEERLTDNNILVFTASIEIDGQVYTGDHVSKTQAKQKACENFLRVLLAKKINERPEKKDDCFGDTDNEDSENVSSVKPKGPPQEDFPWPHFASLAMHNLIAHWELQPVSKVVQEETNIKIPQKVGGMKKFPDNAKNYNPVQLLHQMTPGINFTETTINSNNPSSFQVNCVMNGISFSGQGSTKKAAKKECAIAAIKYFWNFDFHSLEKK